MSADFSLLPFQPSLAQATNTRLDSACKHIQQCRVSTDDMMRFVRNEDMELQRNKYRYCVHKDELVVGVGRAWAPGAAIRRSGNSAYPRVISNLGALGDQPDTRIALNMIRFMNHFARSVAERNSIIKFFQTNLYLPPRFLKGGVHYALPDECVAFTRSTQDNRLIGTESFLGMMYDYFTVGYANTLAYAHANSGDTMTSVMIGGLRTVMNGDFEIFAGDLVQFYWCFEKDDFESNGRRRKYIDIWDSKGEKVECNVDPSTDIDAQAKKTWTRTPDAQVREVYHCLSYGQKQGVEKLVAKIKPYIPDEENPRLNDWYRVFGVAIASARPNEMCDIKISRQSA